MTLQMRPVVNRKNAASRLRIATSVVLLGLGFGLAAFAQEPEADVKDNVAPDHAQRKQWIEDLDSGQFSKRQHATVELRRAGTRVFPLLVEASASESRERSGRAIQILEYYFKNGDADSKAAAEKSLKSVVENGPQRASQRASHILKPPVEPMNPAPGPQQGAIQLQVLGGLVRGAKQIKVSNVNGVKTITSKEPGKTVELKEDPNAGIKMKVTETKNGKKKVTNYEAKNAAELKKKHPDAHKLYQELNKAGRGVFQIQIGGIPGLPQALPPGFPQIRRLPGFGPAKGASVRQAIDGLQESIELLEKAKPGDTVARAEALKKIKAAKEKLEKIK